jgi:hypothetical protein
MTDRAHEKANSLEFRDFWAGAQHIVISALDYFQNLHSAAAEQFEIDGEAAVHHPGEGKATLEEAARYVNRLGHDRAETLIIAMREKILYRVIVPG